MPLVVVESDPGNAEEQSQASPEEMIEFFESQLRRQEDLLYGIALFFEGITLINAGRENIIETYRKQFRNIIQNGKQALQQASDLLKEVKKDKSKVKMLQDFVFTSPCRAYPDPPALAKRARILASKYTELWPNRPRSQPFTTEETLHLMKAAAQDANI